MKKTYTVTFAHYGFVQVEAESELDAYRKVEGYGDELNELKSSFFYQDETDDLK